MFARILKNPIAVIGLCIILLYVGIIIVSQFWLPYDPLEMETINLLQPPSLKTGHILGTDEFGRDIWSRIMAGT